MGSRSAGKCAEVPRMVRPSPAPSDRATAGYRYSSGNVQGLVCRQAAPRRATKLHATIRPIHSGRESTDASFSTRGWCLAETDEDRAVS